jgi:hypothetical protein
MIVFCKVFITFREEDQLAKLFDIAKGLTKPHKDINSVRISVEAMTLLTTHASLYKTELKKAAKELIEV